MSIYEKVLAEISICNIFGRIRETGSVPYFYHTGGQHSTFTPEHINFEITEY